MAKEEKPRAGGQPAAKGLVKKQHRTKCCGNLITATGNPQLLGTFDHDSKSAVIVLPTEVSPYRRGHGEAKSTPS